MTHKDHDHRAYPVPGGRLGRMMRMGALATGILGDVATAGARQLAKGERPRLPSTLLTRPLPAASPAIWGRCAGRR